MENLHSAQMNFLLRIDSPSLVIDTNSSRSQAVIYFPSFLCGILETLTEENLSVTKLSGVCIFACLWVCDNCKDGHGSEWFTWVLLGWSWLKSIAFLYFWQKDAQRPCTHSKCIKMHGAIPNSHLLAASSKSLLQPPLAFLRSRVTNLLIWRSEIAVRERFWFKVLAIAFLLACQDQKQGFDFFNMQMMHPQFY